MKGLAVLLTAGCVLFLSSAAMAAKVDVCHVPPGNPGNAHTISVSSSAVSGHLAHGDTAGACECRVDEDCADDNLCDDDTCVQGKCRHEENICPIGACVASSSCVPATGECLDVPVVCGGDEVCDPSTGQCGPCDFRLSQSVVNPSSECPNSDDCVSCCNEASGGLLESCRTVTAVIDDLPNGCFCLGCGCLE